MSKQEKVICLGKEFSSEDERREYFREELRKKLPELKSIEGFPIGEDEDIINLSDPPYYTACPNPWLNDFIEEWEREKEHIPGRKKDFQVTEPYAFDVSEGKNNPIYYAHSYHTKVPHPAIMRYILHYTQPGDIIFDGFAGTGMTGVAAQMCKDPDTETKNKIELEWKKFGIKPTWGARKAISGDLSPIASFINYNFNSPKDLVRFHAIASEIIDDAINEFSWMYQTNHSINQIGTVNYVVWSDVCICNNCNSEYVYWDQAVNLVNKQVHSTFKCPSCKALQEKRKLERSFETVYDQSINENIRTAKLVPVLINYTFANKRFEKTPDQTDINLINNISASSAKYKFPIYKLPIGYNTRQPMESHGYTHIHHLYSKRNLYIISAFFNLIKRYNIDHTTKNLLIFWFTSSLNRLDKLNRYAAEHKRHVGPLANTLYISSTPVEISPFYFFREKLNAIIKIGSKFDYSNLIGVISATDYKILPDNCVDYIFVDPPFGGNIMYSELNYYYEAWFNVHTNNQNEAIVNSFQNKSREEYKTLMLNSFCEFYRILRPNKWITVEFSNTSAEIWNILQFALTKAGFIITNVSIIDKLRAGLHGIIGPVAVKQDLVITGYKPSLGISNNIKTNDADYSTWIFIEEHLNHLPIFVFSNEKINLSLERSAKMLYDRLISTYIMRGSAIPMDAKDFQIGLRNRFVERDGMYFTTEQAAAYDEKKSQAPELVQLSLVVSNESDAIEWLRNRLRNKPQKYQDIMPDFRIATQSLRKGDTLPELQDILNESFIQESDGRWRLPDPNEARDREALRNKALLKEFSIYVEAANQPRSKKLKEVRIEALRAGFKWSWERKDFKTIVNIANIIPQNLLLEDEQLLMYYDIAKDRI